MPFGLTPLRALWLGLALAGAAMAWAAGLPAPRGGDWAGIAALAVWCLAETMLRRNWGAFVTLPALALGLGCALPLYLFLRSRRVV